MAETSEKRAPGRPPGHPKSGGRQPGSKNAVPAELRRFINQRGRPLEFLAAIADGRKVSAADPEDPSKKVRVYPSLHERTAAAKTLLNKLVPDLKATEVSGPGGHPLRSQTEPTSKLELARMIAFALHEGTKGKAELDGTIIEQLQHSPSLPATLPAEVSRDPSEQAPSVEVHVKSTRPVVANEEPAQSHFIRFEERLPGDRERWSIRDAQDRVIAVAIGRERAQLKAMELGLGPVNGRRN